MKKKTPATSYLISKTSGTFEISTMMQQQCDRNGSEHALLNHRSRICHKTSTIQQVACSLNTYTNFIKNCMLLGNQGEKSSALQPIKNIIILT